MLLEIKAILLGMALPIASLDLSRQENRKN
jgi:hypothetical protein